MDLQLINTPISEPVRINITGSKSESNRLLVLQALFEGVQVSNLSNSDDTVVLQKALSSSEEIIDIHHAGTAMRFLTAYLAVQKGKEVILTGSSRMKERPIGVLVDALRSLGAEISYEEKEGYPPLRINGKELTANKVSLKANISSQYISALLLIGASLTNGLTIELEGKITSVPYIKMTLSLLAAIGISTVFKGNTIVVSPKESAALNSEQHITVESDWSSASYFYSIVALSAVGTSVTLTAYKKDSLQGDSCLAELYQSFGVDTNYNGHEVTLTKIERAITSPINIDLSNAPDIAQTISVTCFGLGVGCNLTGLHTLKIKETDRLEALKAELIKLGGVIEVTNDSLHLEPATIVNKNVTIETYQDHRMAMAFAPLALKTVINISESEVVSKSYPEFWEDMKSLGIKPIEI